MADGSSRMFELFYENDLQQQTKKAARVSDMAVMNERIEESASTLALFRSIVAFPPAIVPSSEGSSWLVTVSFGCEVGDVMIGF